MPLSPKNPMNISVILSTYKRPVILSRTLDSFRALNTKGLSWELIVVDNANDPASQEVVRQYEGKLPLKFLVETKPGKNNALNKAIPEAKAELFVFTDDDVIADPNWLREMWKGANRWPDYSVFGGKILPAWPDGFEPPPNNFPFLSSAYAITAWDQDEGVYSARQVFGANMCIRRSVFEEGYRFNPNIGPTNKKTYIMGSETEFVIRLERDGFQAIYLQDAIVLHQIRPEQMSAKWLRRRAFRAGRGVVANATDFSEKRIWKIPRYLLRRLLSEAVMAFYYLVTKKKLEYTLASVRVGSILGMIYQYLL